MDKHGNGGMQLLDEQWKKMEPLLLGKPGDPGVSAKSNRLFIEGMLWVAMNNGSWGNLPIRFGKMNTAYMRFRRWNMRGIWRQLVESKVDDQGACQIFCVSRGREIIPKGKFHDRHDDHT